MGPDHSKSPTELEQYLTLLQQRGETGLPFILVGGHAVNFWAKLYLNREPRLRNYLPFTSKDLDLIGTKAEAVTVARTLGWQISPPVIGGGPVQAILNSEPAGGLTVEFLSEIKGVSADAIIENAHESVIHIPSTGEPITVRVLDPVLLLAGKIRNAVEIDQNLLERPRQDVKHVTMLAVCIPHFLADLETNTNDPARRRLQSEKYATTLAALKNTYSARQFDAQYPGVVRWPELISP